jgi:hypothetical protein
MDDFRCDNYPIDQNLDDQPDYNEWLEDEEDLLDELEAEDEDAEGSMPNWVYHEMVRKFLGSSPGAKLKLLDAPATGTPGRVPMVDRDPSTMISVFRTAENKICQVHCFREAPKDLVALMSRYRTAIEQVYPHDHLDQYAIVLGDGSIRSPGSPVHTGIHFDLRVLYVKDVEPEWFPLGPGFSLLSRSRDLPTEADLLEHARLTLTRHLVADKMTGIESTPLYDDVENGNISTQVTGLFFQGRFGEHPEVPVAEHSDWATAVWLALAVQAVTDFDEVRRRISHRQGLADVLADVLAERFGEHPDILHIAYRLAASPDLDAVMRDITKATTLDAMR